MPEKDTYCISCDYYPLLKKRPYDSASTLHEHEQMNSSKPLTWPCPALRTCSLSVSLEPYTGRLRYCTYLSRKGSPTTKPACKCAFIMPFVSSPVRNLSFWLTCGTRVHPMTMRHSTKQTTKKLRQNMYLAQLTDGKQNTSSNICHTWLTCPVRMLDMRCNHRRDTPV